MNKHQDAINTFQQGRTAEALCQLEELLGADATAELWNDWAAIQLATGASTKAETGFWQALQLDSENLEAKTNLGLLLLSRGDHVRALPFLECVIPLLPPEQQKWIRALVATSSGKEVETQTADRGPNQSISILVIHDVMPGSGNPADPPLMRILGILRERGHRVTLVAREKGSNTSCEQDLIRREISTYSDDNERLRSLGVIRAPNANWSLAKILAEEKFAIAILSENFRRGFSIPEQYLQDIREYSPDTRIAILPYELQNKHLDGSDGSVPLIDLEVTEDLSQRQRESFARADVVIVADEEAAATLRSAPNRLEVLSLSDDLRAISEPSSASPPGNIVARIARLVPKPKPSEPSSVMLVEHLFTHYLSGKTGEERIRRQLECYVTLADQLLREEKPGEAREQVRHALSRLVGSTVSGEFVAQVFILLRRCYRALGEKQLAKRCALEARTSVTVASPLSRPADRKRTHGTPEISVIIPTYNRLPILKKCLAALEAQTISKQAFEVLVIDDGSSDGTEEAMRQCPVSFGFRYLRQKNSGTGAARCRGVSQAKGEYLLLMNDDTICAENALEQHLIAHQEYGAHWAVLGNFQYPEAARQRALSHYFCVEPFMFPQVSMEDGCPYGYSHFITCNLSIQRQAVLDAGSFDGTYKLSEDTELGIRLFERGHRVLYHPAAHAWHDHLPYPARNLIRRARVYGQDYFYMFRNHPRVMREWAMPIHFTAMDEENAGLVLDYLERNRASVQEATVALERWDEVDFEPFLSSADGTAVLVLSLFRQAVPAIHWFYLFEAMYETMVRELQMISHPRTAVAAAAGI